MLRQGARFSRFAAELLVPSDHRRELAGPVVVTVVAIAPARAAIAAVPPSTTPAYSAAAATALAIAHLTTAATGQRPYSTT
jgi:hypothetical protein